MDISFVPSLSLAAPSAGVLGLAALPGLEWLGGADGYAASLGEGFQNALQRAKFEGKPGQSAVYGTGKTRPHTVVALGLGDEPGADAVRQAAGALGRISREDEAAASTLARSGRTREAVEGFLMSQYRFDRYVSEPDPPRTESLILVGEDDPFECEAGRITAEAVLWARDQVNMPSCDKPPAALAREMEERGAALGLRVIVHGRRALAEGGFGGVLGVAAGSDRPPRLLEVWYDPPAAEDRAFAVFVGKGITFDSGGLSIKPASAMETMKTDMAGAAAVLGAMQAVARMQLPVKVLGLAPLTDNMLGPLAVKPGDVLKTRSGKTIEVLNTDAEGRLVLADALAYGAEHRPDLMVDLATLTGACKIALGEKIAGIMGSDEGLVRRITELGRRAGERMWPLPLPDDYRSMVESPVADMKNIGGRWAGALTAALILKEFTGGVPWAHLDIAGPARWPKTSTTTRRGGRVTECAPCWRWPKTWPEIPDRSYPRGPGRALRRSRVGLMG